MCCDLERRLDKVQDDTVAAVARSSISHYGEVSVMDFCSCKQLFQPTFLTPAQQAPSLFYLRDSRFNYERYQLARMIVEKQPLQKLFTKVFLGTVAVISNQLSQQSILVRTISTTQDLTNQKKFFYINNDGEIAAMVISSQKDVANCFRKLNVSHLLDKTITKVRSFANLKNSEFYTLVYKKETRQSQS
jgi:hypothetical protein